MSNAATTNPNIDREYAELKLKLLQEKVRRENLPINLYTPDCDPTRNQLAFHISPARYRFAFGGNRAGKSVVTSYENAAHARGCHRFQEIPPGPKELYIVSAEYRTLYQGIHRHLAPDRDGMKFIDPKWIKDIGPKIPGATVPLPAFIQVWTERDSGGDLVKSTARDRPFSTIWFISGDGGESARKKLQAAAIDLATVDEEVEELLFEEINARLLDKNGRFVGSMTLIRSEEWLLNFEDRAEEGDPAVCVVRLNTDTSRHITEQAKKEIFGNLSAEKRAIRVEGRSNRQFGLVYPSFDVMHTYDHQKTFSKGFPEDFIKVAAFDPGFRVHAGLWAAVDTFTKTIYFYREIYEKESMLSETCKVIANEEGYNLVAAEGSGNSIIYARVPFMEKPEEISIRLIDPAAFRHMEDGNIGMASQMAAYYNTPCAPANNDVHSGVEAVRRFLEVNPNTGKPHIQVANHLFNFLSERRRYKLRPDTSSRYAHASKGEPVRKNNHLMDTWRYICMWALSMFSDTEPHRRRGVFNHALQNNVALKMADRLEEHAQQLREREARAHAHPMLGSEW